MKEKRAYRQHGERLFSSNTSATWPSSSSGRRQPGCTPSLTCSPRWN